MIIVTLAGITEEFFSSRVGSILDELGAIKYYGMPI